MQIGFWRPFPARAHTRKVTPEIEAYVRDRFLDLQKEQCHNYSKVIQAEVKKYFSVSVSAERLRWIFRDVKDEQGISSSQSETNHGEIDVGTPAGELVVDGANSCEMTNKTADASSPNPTPRNYSLQTMPCSGRILPAAPHAVPSCRGGTDEPLDRYVERRVVCAARLGPAVDCSECCLGLLIMNKASSLAFHRWNG